VVRGVIIRRIVIRRVVPRVTPPSPIRGTADNHTDSRAAIITPIVDIAPVEAACSWAMPVMSGSG